MYRKIMATISTACQMLLIVPIKIYQYTISPLLGPHCRFHPSCSEYALKAVKLHGLFYGGYLMLKRIVRCQPFCSGGYDPVPERKSTRNVTLKG